MANTKITDLTAWTTPIATDVFAIVDVTAASTKKITLANVLGKMPAGSVTAPSLAFTSDPNSGLYWIGADNIGLALNGAKVVDFGAAQIGFPDGSVGLPGIAFAGDTNSGLYWIGADNIGVTLGGVQKLNIGLASMTFSITCTPNSDDGAGLGTGQLSWSDLFLATGGIINWSNGDVTITHSGNTLAFAGATTGYTFDTVVYINDTADTNLTTGLTINQGGADNHIVSLKSSDVAHGMTDNLETDTYASFDKATAASGGLRLSGWAGATTGLHLRGNHTTDNTTKSTAGTGAIMLQAGLKAAADHGNCGADANLVVIRNYATARFLFDAEGTMHSIGATYTDSIGNGLWFLNDTANAQMTTGLTINQGGADNEILAFKSSDVAHGVTGITETDTYAFFAKTNPTEGGLHITGLRATNSPGVTIRAIGVAAAGDPPTTTTQANAVINCALISGTGIAAVGATNPMFAVQNNDTNEFVVMGDGELYSNQSATVGTFDDYDDAVMCGDLSYLLAGQYSKIVSHNRELFSRLGIVTGGGMVSLTKMHQLQLGGINQVGQRLTALEQALMARIQGLERQLLAIQGG